MFLDQIVQHKKEDLARAEQALPLDHIIKKLPAAHSPGNFRGSLADNIEGVSVIAEIKHASPLKGVLCVDFDPQKLAAAYQAGGAKAISVITEERYFKGSAEYIALAKKSTGCPVLRKDFIVSAYQVYESKLIGADAILLIASILDDRTLSALIGLANELSIDALVEVHDRPELKRALFAGANIIGVNNRNLKTFQVDLSTTLKLAGEIPAEVLLVSESGISTREDMVILEKAGVKAVLIGETLVRSPDPEIKLKELLGLECNKS